MTKNKNLDRILLAVKNLNVELVIVGRINIKQISFMNAHNLKYKNYEDVSESNLVNLYNQSIILLFPSLYEGFGLTILEAQKMGVSVITSDISPMKEIVGDSAILVNPKNIKDIRNKLIRLCKNPLLRKRLVKKGYKNLTRFKPENFRNKYFLLYKKIAKS